ncbi:GNAT family N-acetyltransferase [Aliikangiella sp. IMCC44359]|uniref:GNAT family N-acetyltransferase n=1 Tax=Aliikangiella sp. IMCC44359 TaxID=3459125 RepID=UPI00403AE4CA
MSISGLTIDEESVDDYPTIMSLFTNAYHKPYPLETYHWWRNLNSQTLSNSLGCNSPNGLVARIDGKPVGYVAIRLRNCYCDHKLSVAGELGELMVDNSIRRKGIAEALCKHVVEHLSLWKIDIIYGIANFNTYRLLINSGMQDRFTFGRWALVRNKPKYYFSKVQNRINHYLNRKHTNSTVSPLKTEFLESFSTQQFPTTLNYQFDYNLIVKRSIEYWLARYAHSPKTYLMNNTKFGAYVIRLDYYGNMINATLMDLIPSPKTSEKNLSDLLQHSIDYSWSVGANYFEVRAIENSTLQSAIQKSKLSRQKGDYQVLLATVDQSLLQSITSDEVWFTSGDFDVG